eukprot:scaffold2318_cov363-Pavlova_lutheri.AAC.6
MRKFFLRLGRSAWAKDSTRNDILIRSRMEDCGEGEGWTTVSPEVRGWKSASTSFEGKITTRK